MMKILYPYSIIFLDNKGVNMYCRFCGRQIEDDSSFCTYCGKNLSTSTTNDNANKNVNNQNETVVENEETSEEKTSALKGFFILFIPFIIIISIFLAIASSNGSGSGLLTRSIKDGDYSCTTSQDLTSYSITIVPNKYFDKCEIELKLYNSSGKNIFSDTISKQNLKKNSSYTYTFDFGFVNSLTGSSIRYTVTGKCRLI
ncbi:MAG: zinc ribbon domain-containing protein [Erysipelotrichaceae bacterium]|nr:zinc ribbon domain-containing protein [Erysipelotrichaceae bacterium]